MKLVFGSHSQVPRDVIFLQYQLFFAYNIDSWIKVYLHINLSFIDLKTAMIDHSLQPVTFFNIIHFNNRLHSPSFFNTARRYVSLLKDRTAHQQWICSGSIRASVPFILLFCLFLCFICSFSLLVLLFVLRFTCCFTRSFAFLLVLLIYRSQLLQSF